MRNGSGSRPAQHSDALFGEHPPERLQALSAFTRAVINNRGWVPDEDLQAFQDAGFERRHVLDVLTIIAMKTLSNYTNHIAEAPLDDAFADQAWQEDRSAVAS